jgi:hypothetical protein
VDAVAAAQELRELEWELRDRDSKRERGEREIDAGEAKSGYADE